ncbi:hypothetical protein [Pseudomonas brassicacearum]|uniref:hypothetical protein n=1 Tax=Pseudomonas brassicacearum TaxID=930166 RepID=UPI000721885F|nr:hypothetical protein [Pseudomonas brassicacearum]ALQ01443.1 hypothetical protein AK973_0994 [Pseudomonas brassicacearum]
MTNKTITLDRAVAERMSKAIEQDKLFKYNDLQALNAALADPVPPAGGVRVGLADLMREAQTIVESKFIWKRFIDGTPLSNDISVWMAEFARGHVDLLQAELASALEELDTLKDAVHHALDDSEEDAQTGQVTLYRTDFDKLIELVPEEWHDRYHNQSAPALIETLRANGDRIAMEATIVQQAQRIADLEADKGQGEPVATLARKYDDTLLPFVALMRKELHANADKGDRPGWLSMSADTCLLEIIYHFGKLQASVKRGDGDGMAEYGADVANMCMMLLDICGVINLVQHAEQPAPVAVDDCDKALMDRHEAWKAGEANGIASMMMPERRISPPLGPDFYARGWNACLDEVARLNPIKQ